jgi:hypothetical protein
MATNPNSPAIPESEDRPLTADEGWDLILSLYGSAREALAEVGGGEAWIRFLRDEEPEKPAT